MILENAHRGETDMASRINRRDFTTTVAAAGALAALPASARALGANDRVRLGFIGVGNRGDQLLDGFLPHKDCEVVAISDVYEPYLEPANQKVGGKAKFYHDYRKLLDHEGLDAVVIATPDHWHALMFVDACKAGKDVYVEKPLSLTIGEGRRMVEAAKTAKRITQVGLHRRSSEFITDAVKLIRDGAIGKVTMAKSYHHRNESPMGIGKPADCEPPPGLDWQFWLGPARAVKYNPNRCLYKFRWFYDYSGGQLTNFGTHYLDVIQWALGQDAPKSVCALGGKYVMEDNREIPDTMEVVWEYDGCLATFSQINANAAAGNLKGVEMEFRGTTGTMYLHEGRGYEIVPESVRTEELPALSPIKRKENAEQGRATKLARKPETGKKGSSDTTAHARNFLDCVKSRVETHCPVETGHRSTSATLLAKIALQRKRLLMWDPKAERVTNDEEANKLLTYQYREPWKLG
jgi:predicted dehydrogenase